MGCGLTGFPRAMFEQGLLYYVALTREYHVRLLTTVPDATATVINVANLVFYTTTRVSLQSSAYVLITSA